MVLLNCCKSASQINDLVRQMVPFVIGMADTSDDGDDGDDGDAINYAAPFYAAIANGRSINSAHLAGEVRLELNGLDSAELPTLAWAADVDPSTTILVQLNDPAWYSHPATQRQRPR